MKITNVINIWVVYDTTTSDHPGKYVARRFENNAATLDMVTDTDIEKVRSWVQEEAHKRHTIPYRLPPYPEDDPVILETWL